MGYWDYTVYRVLEENQQNIPYLARFRHLENPYRRSKSVLHELTPQYCQSRVDISRQLIGNPMNKRFIMRIDTCDEKSVYYCNLDASKEWLGRRQPVKVIGKKYFRPKMCVWWNFEGVMLWEFVPNGRAVDAFMKLWNGDTQHSLTESSRTMRDPILLKQPWQKFRIWEESSCYHIHRIAQILRLQNEPWPISCVEEISKTLRLWKLVSPNSSHQNQRMVLSRDNERRWKMTQDHRIWWFIHWRVV